MFARFFAVIILIVFSLGAQAALWTLTYPRPLNNEDHRSVYPIALLALALDKTGVRYQLKPSERIMLQSKALRQLRENREINIVWSMTDKQREKELLPIRIPIAKGLIGLRVLLINDYDQAIFAPVTSFYELLARVPVQGEDWPDTKILQANGFNVHTVPSLVHGYEVLSSQRADFFPRSVIEVTTDLDNSQLSPDIVLEPRLAFHYPAAMYFFVNRGNPTLAKLIATGLERAAEDGSFDELFFASFDEIFRRINLDKRKVFELENPLLPNQTPLDDKRLWFTVKQLQEYQRTSQPETVKSAQ